MSAISLPARCWVSVPAYLASLSASDRRSRKRSSCGSKSISLRKLRFFRLYAIEMLPCGSEGRVSFQRTGHAVAAAAALAEFEPTDGDHLDPRLAQGGVRTGVALVGDDDPGFERDDVVPVVPLLALGLEGVPAGLDDAHLGHAQGPGHVLGQPAVLFLGDQVVGRRTGPDRPG